MLLWVSSLSGAGGSMREREREREREHMRGYEYVFPRTCV